MKAHYERSPDGKTWTRCTYAEALRIVGCVWVFPEGVLREIRDRAGARRVRIADHKGSYGFIRYIRDPR